MNNQQTSPEEPGNDATGREVAFDTVAAAAARLQTDGKTVTVAAVHDLLGTGSLTTIYKHLASWRASQANYTEAPKADLPEAIVADLVSWARQFAEQSGSGVRDALAQSESDAQALLKAGEQLEAERGTLLAQISELTAERDRALATIAERAEAMERLSAELRNARQVAMDALVGKAKDQLAIEGKDNQLADLRLQIERNVAAQAAESDARLTAEMELVGAVTARNSLATQVTDLQAQLDISQAERSALRAELETLRKKP